MENRLAQIHTYLVDHVTFRMPALITHIPINLHELLQNRSAAANASDRTTRRVMVMAIYVVVVLIIRIFRAK